MHFSTIANTIPLRGDDSNRRSKHCYYDVYIGLEVDREQELRATGTGKN